MRTFILKSTRKVYRILKHPVFMEPDCVIDRKQANGIIFDLLMKDEPCMISRLGSGEIGIVNNYLTAHSKDSLLQRCYQYITGNTGLPWWDTLYFKSMRNNAGIFPESIEVLEKFSERYLNDIPEMDIIGSFNYTEKYIPLKSDIQRVHLECLYPFFVDNPWTIALKGKKVLVVHPFVETIKSQYSKKNLLFDNKDIWPDYELKTLRAVQSNAGNEVPFTDWFDALKWMEDEIAKIDFDFAIIGCGAYGLSLAATIKRMGKKAIHLGGGSQLLFGIKGKRWENTNYGWPVFPDMNCKYYTLFNDYWVRPNTKEIPVNANKVEGACYW